MATPLPTSSSTSNASASPRWRMSSLLASLELLGAHPDNLELQTSSELSNPSQRLKPRPI